MRAVIPAIVSAIALAAVFGRKRGKVRGDDNPGRADQIAEHHGQLPAFGINVCRRIAGYCRPCAGYLDIKRGDGVEQSPAVPDQSNAKILQILGGQSRQHPCVDLVQAERLFGLYQPETVESCRYATRSSSRGVTPG